VSGARILVVDDDAGIRESLARELRTVGYLVLTAAGGLEAAAAAASAAPDLVLTDLMMPAGDGFGLIAALRARGSVPIVVLSVRGGEQDKVRALDLGADDHVTKPFSVAELLARVRAQLRRSAPVPPDGRLEFVGLVIDLDRRRVVEGEREVRLTPTEYSLLETFARHAGKPLTLRQLIARVWAGAPGTSADTVRVHVGALRRKLEPDPANPRYLVTEPWVGYRFIADPIGSFETL
jgi:two-component system KDP operon response regulator KdpE